jgi:integrase
MKQTAEIRTEIYAWRHKAYDHLVKRIEEWQENPANKEHLKRILKHKLAKKTSCVTIAKTLTILMRIFEMIDKDAGTLTETDVEDLMIRINTNPNHSDATKNDYGRALKEFLLLWEDKDPRLDSINNEERKQAVQLYKYAHKHIKNVHKSKTWDFSEIINVEDFWNLLNGCRTPMEEAVLAILFWTGVRAGELASLRIKDIQFEPECVMIRVAGKTRDRRIPLIEPAPYIKKWLQQHPFKDNPNSLLWISDNNKYYNKPLRYVGFKIMLERIFEKAGYLQRYEQTEEEKIKKVKGKIAFLKKKCNLHWMRHGRATLWAPIYKEQILCELMGWQSGSKQAKVYLHLGGSQVKDAFLEANNLIKKENHTPDMITCICGELNNRKDKYCYKCYRPLSINTALIDAENRKNAIDEAVVFMAQIVGNPELKRQFEEFQKSKVMQ